MKWYLSQNIYKSRTKNWMQHIKRRRARRKPWIFFLTIYHSYSSVTLLFQQGIRVKWPPWSLEDLPIRKEGNPNTLLHDNTIFGDPKAWLQLPRNDVIHVNLSVDVANFRNGEVERNSLDQHLTESGHQEILHQSCCCNTGSLWSERFFIFSSCSFRQDIHGAKS